jgi:hypothetical protein
MSGGKRLLPNLQVRDFRRGMSRRSHLRRALAAMFGVVALTAAAAASGVSDAGLKTESASETVTAASDRASARPRCDGGTRAISGGFETNADVTARQVYVIGSARSGRRGWTVSAHNFSPDDAQLTAFAYCRDERTTARSKNVEVEGAGDGTAVAKCRRGKEAVAGGFDLPGADPAARPIIAYESRRVSKRKWTVTASNTDGESGELQAHVYCRKAEGLRASKRTETLTGPGLVDADVIARCRPSERVVSGGFASDTVPLPGKGRLVDVTASRKLGKRKWRVSVAAIGTGLTIAAYAYCEST